MHKLILTILLLIPSTLFAQGFNLWQVDGSGSGIKPVNNKNLTLAADNQSITFGAGSDASVTWDASKLLFSGGPVQYTDSTDTINMFGSYGFDVTTDGSKMAAWLTDGTYQVYLADSADTGRAIYTIGSVEFTNGNFTSLLGDDSAFYGSDGTYTAYIVDPNNSRAATFEDTSGVQVHLCDGGSASYFTDGTRQGYIASGTYAGHFEDGTTSVYIGDGTYAAIFDGGNVGIGTSTPDAYLTVVGSSFPVIEMQRTTAVASYATGMDAINKRTTGVAFSDSDGASMTFSLQTNADVHTFLGQVGAKRDGADNTGKLYLQARNAGLWGDPVVIDKDGGLGIGTAAPTQPFELYSNDTANLKARINHDNATGDPLLYWSTNTTNWAVGIDNSDNDNFEINPLTNMANGVFVIQTDGNVGIGTQSPDELLHVSNDGDVYAKVEATTGSGQIAGVKLQRGIWQNDVYTDYSISNDTGVFTITRYASGASVDRFAILDDGDAWFGGFLGVNGETSPSSPLHVSQNDSEVGGAVGLTIEQNGLGDSTVNFLLPGITRWQMGIDNSDSDKFKISPSVNVGVDPAITIDTAGNVGINHNNPQRILHIHEDSGGEALTQYTNDTTGSTNTDGVVVGLNVSEGAQIWNFESDYFRVGTSNTERMRITSGGTLLIGTTTGTGSSDKAIVFGDNSSDVTPGSNTSAIYGKDVSGTVEVFVADEAGNATQISPHNFTNYTPRADDTFPWSYHSRNEYLGVERSVDISGAILALEELTGKTFIHDKQIPKKDWQLTKREQLITRRMQTKKIVDKAEAIELLDTEETVNTVVEVTIADAFDLQDIWTDTHTVQQVVPTEEALQTVDDGTENVPLAQAFESIEIMERVEDGTTTEHFYEMDDQGVMKVHTKEVPQFKEQGTGEFRKQLKSGVTFNPETGKFVRNKTKEVMKDGILKAKDGTYYQLVEEKITDGTFTTTYDYQEDDQGQIQVVEVQTPNYIEVKTGQKRKVLKEGVNFNPETGKFEKLETQTVIVQVEQLKEGYWQEDDKFFRNKTREEAIASIKQGDVKQPPKWIKDRLAARSE